MYLSRKADLFLEKWFQDESRKPLIIKGARQVGKTETIRNFANRHFESVIEINFALESKYRTICSDGYEAETIIRNISRIDPSKKFISHKTLLFFDELQEYPDISTSLKSFKEDGQYDVILSGSLLGINYQRIESNRVGFKTEYQMYSLDFEEFLFANGYDSDITGSILKHMLENCPFSDSEWMTLQNLFIDFCILGGMPAVVRGYIEKKNFSGSLQTQQEILLDYREDIRKYAGGLDQTRITRVFDHIPVQLAKDNKKFQISKVAHGARFRDYAGCIEWLNDAGIINICYCMSFPELPLKGNYDETKYKIYFADTGLLVASMDEFAQEDLRANKNLGVYKGALFENMVAEALVKAGAPVYYYKREDSQLEEDFFLRSRNYLVPIEVKSKNNRSRSLRTLIDSDRYPDISYGVKLVQGNIGADRQIHTFPYFCAFALNEYLRQLE